jgi:hypothetical protein
MERPRLRPKTYHFSELTRISSEDRFKASIAGDKVFWVVTHGIAILGKDVEAGGIAKPTDNGAAAKPTVWQSSPKRGRAAGSRSRGALLSL